MMLLEFYKLAIFHSFGHYFAGACDTFHLAPWHHMRVPGLAVLVVVSLPGAAPRGQDVQAAPLTAHVVQFVAVVCDDRVGGRPLR